MTLTTERLKQLADPNRIRKCSMVEYQSMARELLVTREAQPVAIVESSDYVTAAQIAGDEPRSKAVKELYEGALVIGQHLYTAPPAPAKAVAWEMRYWSDGYNIWGDWERITAEQHAEMSVKYAADNDYEFRVLYHAPPVPKSNAADWGINMQTGTPILVYKNCSVIESKQAYYVLSLINSAATPAPAVPDMDTIALEAARLVVRDVDRRDDLVGGTCQLQAMIQCHIETACRAAMLAQPVSGGYKLPESWIACSEQTPVADGAYWCWFGKEKPSVIQQRVCIWNDRNHEWCDSAVTHWMPLPVAPEGGNG
ncbi:TPA: DUF551 domain-containing protein [Serratia marcescens]